MLTDLHRGIIVPITDGISQYLCRQNEHKYKQLGKLHVATANVILKQGFNLERLEQPTVEPKLLFDTRLTALSEANHISRDNLMSGSGQGGPLQWLTRFTAMHLVHEAMSIV